uniref:LRRNT domain-containing protein n=1 Tax=Timema cristinae TaxID=61476 RepID=A0A7R9DBG5_TIMCR|nr:unnamed protein product [Timema cristinae]
MDSCSASRPYSTSFSWSIFSGITTSNSSTSSVEHVVDRYATSDVTSQRWSSNLTVIPKDFSSSSLQLARGLLDKSRKESLGRPETVTVDTESTLQPWRSNVVLERLRMNLLQLAKILMVEAVLFQEDKLAPSHLKRSYSSGEDVGNVVSARASHLLVEVVAGTVDWTKLCPRAIYSFRVSSQHRQKQEHRFGVYKWLVKPFITPIDNSNSRKSEPLYEIGATNWGTNGFLVTMKMDLSLLLILWFMLHVDSRTIDSSWTKLCPVNCTCNPNSQEVTCSGIANVPDIFPTGVKVLQITRGNITCLGPESLRRNLEQLEYLKLDKDSILKITKPAFRNLELVSAIDISNNNLTSIHPDTFLSNINLEYLRLSRNLGLDIGQHTNFINSFSIRHLNLRHCNIRTVSTDTFSGLTKLSLVDLTCNPLYNCNKQTKREFLMSVSLLAGIFLGWYLSGNVFSSNDNNIGESDKDDQALNQDQERVESSKFE